jgi:hypothetical protein
MDDDGQWVCLFLLLVMAVGLLWMRWAALAAQTSSGAILSAG